jgi:hypothetical protein
VTAGDEKGTSGWPRFEWGPWLLIACIGAAVAFVNSTSILMETEEGRTFPFWAPFLWEYSSWLMLLGLAPGVGEAIRRVPPTREKALKFALSHFGVFLVFSVVHVAGMVTMRKLGYWAAGSSYDFTHGNLPLTFLYEARKDAVTYTLFAIIYFLFRRGHPAPAADGDRIEIRDGGAAIYLPPGDILFVEAAGNYVEFHTATRAHLVRGTLAAWEARLTARGFVRVHRSRLVNRARIASLKPTPSGDMEITLDTGAALIGSRRYRAGLETSPNVG